jgi:hypothetical protein
MAASAMRPDLKTTLRIDLPFVPNAIIAGLNNAISFILNDGFTGDARDARGMRMVKTAPAMP